MEAIELGIALSSVILGLATLPGTSYLAVLTIAGLLPARRPPSSRRCVRSAPSVRIGDSLRVFAVIPAHDEEDGIERCIESLHGCQADGETFRIVVVADNCTDHTAQRARAAGADVLERTDPENPGKGAALQWAFDQLVNRGADVLLVVDADSQVEANLVAALRTRFGNGADAVQVPYGVANPGASLRTRLQHVALLAFNRFRLRGRARLGLSAGILGNGFALSRETLRAVPYDAHSVVEDLEYHLALVRSGRKVEFAPETGVRADMPVGGRGAETQRARWEGGRLRMIREVAPALAREVATGRPRLIEPLFELLLLPLAFHVTLLVAIGLLPWEPGRAYAAAAIAVVGLHVLAGILVGGGGVRDVAALFAAPFYVVWKLGLARAILRTSRRDSEWVRTERAAATGDHS